MAEDVAFTLKTLSTTRKVLSGLSPKTVLRGIVVACRSSNKPEEVGVTGVQMEDPPLRMGGSADSALVNHSWVLAHAALNNMVTVAARPCPAGCRHPQGSGSKLTRGVG